MEKGSGETGDEQEEGREGGTKSKNVDRKTRTSLTRPSRCKAVKVHLQAVRGEHEVRSAVLRA